MRKLLIIAALALIPSTGEAQAAPTPSPNLNDQALLAADQLFQNRAYESALGFCFNTVLGESPHTVAYHAQRMVFCQAAILNTTGTYPVLIAKVSAANATVVSDATAAGATPITSANADAQQALVLDPDLNNAVAAAFNLFIGQP